MDALGDTLICVSCLDVIWVCCSGSPRVLTNGFRVGALVSGTVRRLEGFGAFIGLDDAGPVSGLLHVSNISRQRVDYPEVRQPFVISTSIKFDNVSLEPCR